MAATFEPIASTTLGSAAATITLSGIPGTYTDLVAVLAGSTTETSANDLKAYLNSDTGSNYSYTQVYGNGTSAASNRISSTNLMRLGTASPTETFAVIQIMSYANTNVYKTILTANGDPASVVVRAVNLWRSTAAVTSITFSTQTSKNFSAGFTASLYGIQAA